MQASARQVIQSTSQHRQSLSQCSTLRPAAGSAPQRGIKARPRPEPPAPTTGARRHSGSASSHSGSASRLSTSAASNGGGGSGASGRPSRLRRQLATVLVFVWSGLEHELFHWYAHGRTSGGRWFTFFAIQVRHPRAGPGL
jgi:hypothetical protein